MTVKPPSSSTLAPDAPIETLATVTFTEIRDANDKLIGNDEVTYDLTLTCKGTAAPNTELGIRDGLINLEDTTSQSNGNWLKALTLSTFKRYQLIAQEKKPPQDFSRPAKTFILATETPIIKEVIGKNGPIQSGATYDGDSLEFTGYAPPGMEVEALNGDTSTGKKATVDSEGAFKLILNELTAGPYTIKIKAANGKESSEFEFRVIADIKLTLDEVADSNGPIEDGDTTYETEVTVKGSANPGDEIQLLDDNNTIVGATTTAEADGTWQILLPVVIKTYKLTASSSSGDVTAPPYTIIVKLHVDLSLDEVTDSKGDTIPADGSTYDNKVIIKGFARPDDEVQLLDNGSEISGATTTAGADGAWQIEIPVTHRTYSFTARANGEVSDPPYTITVKADVKLVLDDVKDSDGTTIPERGTTSEGKVTVSGYARPDADVQLCNKGSEISDATATARDVDGFWEIELDVTNGDYSLTVKALYGEGEISSPARTFNVEAIVKPRNTRVYDSDGLIEDNGTTPYNWVIARGEAAPSQAIRLKINGDSLVTPVPVDDKGQWAKLVQNLDDETEFKFIAVADYGDNAESNSWTINTTTNPVIESITTKEGKPIPNGGSAPSGTTLTIAGYGAAANKTVLLLLGTNVITGETVNADGTFQLFLSVSGPSHPVKATVQDANFNKSNEWTFSVDAP